MSSELAGSHVDVRDGDVRSMAQSYEGFGEGSVLQAEPIAASIDDGSEPLAYRLAFGLVHSEGAGDFGSDERWLD